MVGTALLILALVFAVLAALSVPNFGRLQHGWFALALYLASLLVGGMRF
jgi:hypothetical protein